VQTVALAHLQRFLAEIEQVESLKEALRASLDPTMEQALRKAAVEGGLIIFECVLAETRPASARSRDERC